MPIVMPINSVVQVTLEGRLYGQQVMNIFHYQLRGAAEPDRIAAVNDLANKLLMEGYLKDKWSDCMTVNVTDTKMKVQVVKPTRLVYKEFFWIPNTGNVSGNAAPANLGMVFTRVGAEANKKNRGTTHLTGLPYAWITQGSITDDAKTAMAGLADQATNTRPALTGGIWQPVLYDRLTSLVEMVDAVGYRIQTTVRVERRRTVGVGS